MDLYPSQEGRRNIPNHFMLQKPEIQCKNQYYQKPSTLYSFTVLDEGDVEVANLTAN